MFITIPEEKFLEMVLKTWIMLFKTDDDFEDIKVIPAYPDDTSKLALPTLVVQQVSNGQWALARNNGYYVAVSGSDSTKINERRGYRYQTSYQFDLLTRTVKDQLQYEGKIMKKLRRSADIASSDGYNRVQIPVNDYTDYPTVVATDLRIEYNYWKDVSAVRVADTTDYQIHQKSITVDFWIDYMKDQEYDRIMILATSGIIMSGWQN